MSLDLQRTDVIIIGAGAAGLAAASRLAQAGREALLVEARARIGGRIWSHAEPGLPVAVELGAEFIHGRGRSTFALLDKAGGAAVDACGERWALRDGTLAPSLDLFAEVSTAMKSSRALDGKDMPFDVFLDRYLRDALSPEARAFARLFAQGFDAADTRRASARAIVEEWTGGSSVEGPQFRPMSGYGSLLHALARGLRGSSVHVRLDTVVTAVRWSRGSVKVTGMSLGRPFEAHAKRAVITLPLGVLQSRAATEGAVRFTPALTAKRAALRLLAPGPVLKVLLRFQRAFWEELDGGRYRNAAFFRAREASFPTLWTALPVRAPLLACWAGGPKAERLGRADKDTIISEAMKSVRMTFASHPEIDATLENAWAHDWQRDPYARGAYSYVLAHGGKARGDLAKPLLRTLFFAGEATDIDEAGTVEGALRSGERAGEEVLAVKG